MAGGGTVTRVAVPPRRAEEGTERRARDRALLWLNCRLGERVNVEVGGAWALEAHGELRDWRAVAGLYRVGDTGLLDLTGIGEVVQVRERDTYPGAEQMTLEFDGGVSLTVTVEPREV
jgi:hypothetical protein